MVGFFCGAQVPTTTAYPLWRAFLPDLFPVPSNLAYGSQLKNQADCRMILEKETGSCQEKWHMKIQTRNQWSTEIRRSAKLWAGLVVLLRWSPKLTIYVTTKPLIFGWYIATYCCILLPLLLGISESAQLGPSAKVKAPAVGQCLGFGTPKDGAPRKSSEDRYRFLPAANPWVVVVACYPNMTIWCVLLDNLEPFRERERERLLGNAFESFWIPVSYKVCRASLIASLIDDDHASCLVGTKAIGCGEKGTRVPGFWLNVFWWYSPKSIDGELLAMETSRKFSQLFMPFIH